MDDSTARIRSLEQQVVDLRVANEGLATNIAHLTASVQALTDTVQSLRDTMNQGKGALWLAMGASGAIGALSVIVAKRMLGLG